MQTVKIGRYRISRLCIGGNPFSGFSHQSKSRDEEMRQYYTPERIRQTLRQAEQAGINTLFARTDEHIMEIIRVYREEGGKIQWFAQVSNDDNDPEGWRKWVKAAISMPAEGIYIHGGIVDYWYANGLFNNFYEALRMVRDVGVTAGFAGHNPEAHAWIRDHLDVDFQMCSHYYPTDRSADPRHTLAGEKWSEEDRRRMVAVIQTISKPVVHYKIFAGGNRSVGGAFRFLSHVMRQNDVVCVGMFLKDNPGMIEENIALFETYIRSKIA